MAKLSIQAGATSQSVNVFVQDSSSTTGAGLSGLVFNTASLIAYYTFTGANATATSIALATLAAVNSAYSSGGFKELDATNMKGLYRLDIPNAALATSKGQSVTIILSGATNMAPVVLEIELTGWNNQDGVRGGMTALPNAAAAASGGLPILGANTTAISFTGGMTISNASGDALTLTSSGSNGNGINASGNGTGAGFLLTGGSTGNGLKVVGGGTSGDAILTSATSGHGATFAGSGTTKHGINATGGATTSDGIRATGGGAGNGFNAVAGATGIGLNIVGGSSSGVGISVTTTSGDGVSILPTAGNGILVTANGTSKHGIVSTGGTAGTSDGIKAVAGTGGVDIRGNITGNITGNLSGSAGSVTAQVTANVAQWNGTNVATPNTAGVPKVDVVSWLGTAVTGTTAGIPDVNTKNIANAAVSTASAQIGVNVVNIGGSVSTGAAGYVGVDWGQVTNKTTANALTATTISTSQVVASVTGAVGSVTGAVGSVTGAVGSVTGAVGSVTGNVGGNVVGTVASVVGAVGSVTAGVTVTTNNDKTGYTLSAGGNTSVATAVLTSTMTESYSTLGQPFTLAQGIYDMHQQYSEQSIVTTTMSAKKRDQTTVAKTWTLNSATTPTAITEAS